MKDCQKKKENQSPENKTSVVSEDKASAEALNSHGGKPLDNTPTHISKIKKEIELDYKKALFEMLQLLDEKITNLIMRFDKLAKELGYKV